jgi:hypothetical protein
LAAKLYQPAVHYRSLPKQQTPTSLQQTRAENAIARTVPHSARILLRRGRAAAGFGRASAACGIRGLRKRRTFAPPERTGANLLQGACKGLVASKFAASKEAAKWGKCLSEAVRDAQRQQAHILQTQQHSCRRTFFGTVVLKKNTRRLVGSFRGAARCRPAWLFGPLRGQGDALGEPAK